MTKSERTQEAILRAGVKLWPNVTARQIARNIGMTHPVVAYHFPNNLEDAVATYAVETGNSRVIAQLIATKHKAVRKMSQEDRSRHLDAIGMKFTN